MTGRTLITQRVADLRAALPDGVNLNYAMKANPKPAVVQHAAGLVDGIDVASALEMNVALDTVMPRERISFAGPGKTEEEIARAVAAGIVINLESENEMEIVARHAADLGLVYAGRGTGKSGFRAQDVGHADERRPQAVRRRCRARAGDAEADG